MTRCTSGQLTIALAVIRVIGIMHSRMGSITIIDMIMMIHIVSTGTTTTTILLPLSLP
jgi:hypothetical protein